jgi:hypothetical protein
LAVQLQGEGQAEIKIIGDGRIYTLKEFALTVINSDF